MPSVSRTRSDLELALDLYHETDYAIGIDFASTGGSDAFDSIHLDHGCSCINIVN